jgi:hypothetical protein
MLFPAYSYGWGREGHEIVGRLAYEHLSPRAKAGVDRILGTITPEQAAVWMDEQRSDHRFDYMKPWHYINIDTGKDYQASTDENIANKIIEVTRELGHRHTICAEQVQRDLMILFHLMGDMYQPLHCGYESDLGGNRVKVTYNGKKTNLHKVWDSDIIEAEGIDINQVSDELKRILASDIIPDVIKEFSLPTKVERMIGGNRNVLSNVYSFGSDSIITHTYVQRAKPVIKSQLALAALNLKALLEYLFAGDGSDASTALTSRSGTTAAGDSANKKQGTTLTPEEAAQHVGEIVTVCGKVFGTKYTGGTGPTFINMGAPYPQSHLTVVIFGKDRSRFPYKPEKELDDKTICVTGTVKEYKGKAEIIVSESTQIIQP